MAVTRALQMFNAPSHHENRDDALVSISAVSSIGKAQILQAQ